MNELTRLLDTQQLLTMTVAFVPVGRLRPALQAIDASR